MGAQAVRLSNVDIDNALRNKDFEVLFQPIFDLGNGALARVETFVRWRHPSLGILPPGAFISFFESQGRMSELTRYVLDEALTEYRDWRGPSAPGFSINLALSDLSDESFSSHFDVALRDKGFPADLITLECPMPPVTMPDDVAAAHFQRLAQTGARLAIEVRGRANDFLRTVDPFPFDEIKTGGAAILRFARTVRGPGLSAISELLDIANKANAAITAVGVEDQASLAALRGLGFAAAQGNHLAKVGALSTFTPSRVNEVRTLLGLEPLSNQDLHALFRTEAPKPAAAMAAPASHAPAAPEPDNDALMERLAARVAEQAQAEAPKIDRALAKAEVIKRAKQKKAAARAAAARAQAQADESTAARELQDRLSREFEEAAFAPDSAFAHNEPGAGARDDDADHFAFAPEQAVAEPKTTQDRVVDVTPEPVDSDAEATHADEPIEAQAVDPATARMHEQAETMRALRTSLAVGAARASFRPGFRVGIVSAKPETPPAPRSGDGAAKPAPMAAPELREGAPLAEGPAHAATPQTEAPPQPEIDLPADAFGAEAPFHAETAAPESKPRRRRKKNFLTRKYDIRLPDHFWPKSWTRAWRRREVAMARRRAEREEAAAAE